MAQDRSVEHFKTKVYALEAESAIRFAKESLPPGRSGLVVGVRPAKGYLLGKPEANGARWWEVSFDLSSAEKANT